MENYSLSDVAAVTRGNDGFGWGADGMGFFWIFALLLLPGLFGGGFWGSRGANGEPVTEAGLCNAMNFNNLENAVGRLGDSQTAGFNGLQRDLCQGFSAINAGINQVRFDNQQCCCETQRLLDRNDYNAAMNTASINATTTAQTQKILDAICGNRMADMQNQINQLQLHAALCGIPRTTPYGYGIVPQFAQLNCGCGCSGNI